MKKDLMLSMIRIPAVILTFVSKNIDEEINTERNKVLKSMKYQSKAIKMKRMINLPLPQIKKCIASA
jgi:hypothetical protein